jgi:hypothetical protein
VLQLQLAWVGLSSRWPIMGAPHQVASGVHGCFYMQSCANRRNQHVPRALSASGYARACSLLIARTGGAGGAIGDGEYSADSDSDDDEATLEEEEALAAEEVEDEGRDELAELDEEANLPIEALLAR